MTPSGASGHRFETVCHALHTLMVPAIDAERITLVQFFLHQRPHHAALGQPDFVGHGIERGAHPVFRRTRNLIRDVLHERAAGGHVQHLQTAADRQHGQVGLERPSSQRQFVLVALGVHLLHARVTRLAVPLRIQVYASGQQQTPAPSHHLVNGVGCAIQRTRLAACPVDRFQVVGKSAARGDGDQWCHGP